MLGNAVSSALDRLYASAPVAEDRMPVQRVTAVGRVRAAEDGSDERSANQRDAREQATQRQALTQGVRAVFESSAAGDAAAGAAERKGRPDAAEEPKSDPLLEEAILRFIHTVFRSLAQADGSEPAGGDTGTADASNATVAGASTSRSALGARIGALAQRYAEAKAGAEAATDLTGSAQAVPEMRNAAGATLSDTALGQAFGEVMQALRGNTGGAEPVQTSRGELVNLMQRLAQAMQGAPPVDPGLPTRGGLISTRA